jgi:Protein of unknown function (DUF1580)
MSTFEQREDIVLSLRVSHISFDCSSRIHTRFCNQEHSMPIIPTTDKLISLRSVPKLLEDQIGKRINLATIYRWKSRGISGIRLETVQVAGGSFTTSDALNEFFATSTLAKQKGARVAKSGNQLSSSQASRQRQIDREADQLGI